jgi:N-acetylmuramoyl-L-alanine amidase
LAVLNRLAKAIWTARGAAVLAVAVMAAGLVAVAASDAATASAGILRVRLGGNQAQTRIVIDLDHSASGRLADDGGDGRIVLLLAGASAAGGQQGGAQGLVKRWVISQDGGAARLQLELAADAKVTKRFLLPPADGVDHYRYVIDLAPVPPGEVRLTRTAAPGILGLRTGFLPPKTPPPLALKKVIVIDAGHGGHDPGARGQFGFEKDVNLAAALALKARLEQEGRYKVVLTRDADVYIPLVDRVRIAQRADADLFISLHSDSGPSPQVRGSSVYTLSDKASMRAARFVSNDDWFMKASLTGDRGVSDILFDLTQRATKNRSAAFAEILVSHIEGRTPLLRRTHRDAGFMVLLAPDVPAVLLEMGFVSNAEDEAMLRDPPRRDQLMDGVADSIDEYFAENTRVAAR